MSRQARKTAAQVAQKWSTNLSAATPQMTAGVQGVQTSPTQLAAANPGAYLAGVQNAVNSGKWQAKLNSVSLGTWQQAYITKGIPRVQQAATTDKQKVQNAFTPLLNYVYNARDQVNATMPRGTLQQNIQRSVAMMQAMSQYNSANQ